MGDKRKRIRDSSDRRGDQQGMHGINFTMLMPLTVFDEKGPCDKRRTTGFNPDKWVLFHIDENSFLTHK
jgi:hypothetical protein